jgi:hypothetical protein
MNKTTSNPNTDCETWQGHHGNRAGIKWKKFQWNAKVIWWLRFRYSQSLCRDDCWTACSKMKALRSFDTLVTVYHSTSQNIPENLNLEQHCWDDFRFFIHIVTLKNSIPSSRKRHPTFTTKASLLILERSSLSHVTLQTLGEWELGRKKCKTNRHDRHDRHDIMSIYNQDEKCLQRGTDWGMK